MDENDKLKFAQIKLEREKIAFEKEKLKAETQKTRWTNLSIFVPLLIAALTIFFNAQSQIQQAKSQFTLEALQIIMAEESPAEAYSKANFLAMLFEGNLPDNFVENSGRVANYYEERHLESRIRENPTQKDAIIEAWLLIYPDDIDEEWFNKLR